MGKRLELNILLVLVFTALIVIILTYKSLLYQVFADSPSVDHQSIPNTSKKWQLQNLKENIVYARIHDGRKIYFHIAHNLSQCKIDLLPKLSSVTYLSDGKNLNTTFWLSDTLLNGTYAHYPFANATNIHQRFFDISVNSTKNNTLTELINHTNRTLTRTYNFTDVKAGRITQMKLDGNQAYKLEFTGKLKLLFGNFGVNATEVLAVKDKKIYNILYVQDSSDHFNFKPIIDTMIDSFRIINGTGITNVVSQDGTPYDSNKQTQYFYTYTNASLGIKIKYPYNWDYLVTRTPDEQISNNKRTSEVLFFSRTNPYLLQSLYEISIHEPSIYKEDTDFITQLNWDDTINNKTWTKEVLELSPDNQNRVIDRTHNYKDYFEKGKSYVKLPVDLGAINSPNQYLMIFSVEQAYIKDGHLCDLLDATHQVASPPPKFSLLLSSNSSSVTLSPGDTKTVEVKIKSYSDILSNATFYTDTRDLPIRATFSPTLITIPPSQWATTELTLKCNQSTNLSKPTISETIPIFADITFPKRVVNVSPYNTTTSITAPSLSRPPEISSLTITIFSLPDSFLHSLNIWLSPINGLIAAIGAIITILGVLFARQITTKKGNGGSGETVQPVLIADELTKIMALKKLEIISEDEFLRLKQDFLKRVSNGRYILSDSIVDQLRKIDKLQKEGSISSQEFVKMKSNILKNINIRSGTLKAVTIIEIISAIFGFWGGILLLIDPSGTILGLGINLLPRLPLRDFLLPGIWLVVVYGCGCSFAAYGLWIHKRWGRQLAVIISFIWIGWLSFELYFWGISEFNRVWPWLIPPISTLLLLWRYRLQRFNNQKFLFL